MNATNFDRNGLITASWEVRGTLDGTLLPLCPNRNRMTNGKRARNRLHSLKLENQIWGSLITVRRPKHETPIFKPVCQLSAISTILPCEGHFVLGVDVSSHCDIQSGKVKEAGEGRLGEEGRDEEGEFRGCVPGWVCQGECVGGHIRAKGLLGGAELYHVSN